MRPAEGEELARNDPVEVPVLCALIVLVLLHVKVGEVEPAVLQSLAQGDMHLIKTIVENTSKKIRLNTGKMTHFVNSTKAVEDVQIVQACSK